jgi:hypothetical protein
MTTYDTFNASIATSSKSNPAQPITYHIPAANRHIEGVLNAAITPAEYCSFIDNNNNTQLNRFGVRNGGDQNSTLLN